MSISTQVLSYYDIYKNLPWTVQLNVDTTIFFKCKFKNEVHYLKFSAGDSLTDASEFSEKISNYYNRKRLYISNTIKYSPPDSQPPFILLSEEQMKTLQALEPRQVIIDEKYFDTASSVLTTINNLTPRTTTQSELNPTPALVSTAHIASKTNQVSTANIPVVNVPKGKSGRGGNIILREEKDIPSNLWWITTLPFPDTRFSYQDWTYYKSNHNNKTIYVLLTNRSGEHQKQHSNIVVILKKLGCEETITRYPSHYKSNYHGFVIFTEKQMQTLNEYNNNTLKIVGVDANPNSGEVNIIDIEDPKTTLPTIMETLEQPVYQSSKRRKKNTENHSDAFLASQLGIFSTLGEELCYVSNLLLERNQISYTDDIVQPSSLSNESDNNLFPELVTNEAFDQLTEEVKRGESDYDAFVELLVCGERNTDKQVEDNSIQNPTIEGTSNLNLRSKNT